MGLCPIILYLYQFVTEAFMTLVTLMLFFASAEYHFNSSLEGTLEIIFSNLFCPHTPCSRANSVRLLQKVLNILKDPSSSATLVHVPVFENTHGRKKKILISNQNFLCPVFPVAFFLLLHTSVSIFSMSFQWVGLNRNKLSSQPSPSGRRNLIFSDSSQMWLCGHVLCLSIIPVASVELAWGCPCLPRTGELKTGCSPPDALSHRNTPELLVIVEGTIMLNTVQARDKDRWFVSLQAYKLND